MECLNNLYFSHVIVKITESNEELQAMQKNLNKKIEESSLKINFKKLNIAYRGEDILLNRTPL